MEAGDYVIAQEKTGTRYVWVVVRTFANMKAPDDLLAAHALQDQIVVTQDDQGALELPNWYQKSRETVRGLINQLGNTSNTDFRDYFGCVETLDPIKHLLGAAYGWGGNRENGAMYWGVTPDKNDGETAYVLNITDQPFKEGGCGSVSVDNKDGFFEKNKYDAYSFSNITAEPNEDSSFTIQFGGCPDAINILPIQDGWNCTTRVYELKRTVVDDVLRFPAAELTQ